MKYLIALLSIAPVALFSQERFNKQYDLEFPFHVFTSVLPTEEGYYVTGIVTDTTNGVYKVGSIFLKLDLEGQIILQKTLLSENRSYQTWRGDLISDEDGNLIDVAEVSDSLLSVAIVKFSPQGDTLETHQFFNPLYPAEDLIYPTALKKRANGGYHVLCGIDSGIDTGPDAINNNIFLLEINGDGQLTNSYEYGQPGVAEFPNALLVDDDGGLIVGASVSNRPYVWNNFYSRTYIFKAGVDGGVVWEYQSPSGTLQDIAYDMVEAFGGGIIVASARGIEHPINPSASQLRWHSFLFKLNEDHEVEWEQELRGMRHSASTGFRKIVPAHDGSGYVATGRLIEDVSYTEPVFGSWLVKVSPSGDSLWSRYYSVFSDTIARPNPYDLKNTPDGGYVIVGETKPSVPGVQVPQRAWIMKLDQYGCLIPGCEEGDTVILDNTGLPVPPELRLAIYPNPTSDFLNFQLRGVPPGSAASFRITDATGRTIKNIDSRGAGDTHIVPVGGWGSGVYFLQYLEGGEVRVTAKFVVGS